MADEPTGTEGVMFEEPTKATEPAPEAKEQTATPPPTETKPDGQPTDLFEGKETLSRAEVEKLVEQAKASVKAGYEGTLSEQRRQLAEAKKAQDETRRLADERRVEAETQAFIKQAEENGVPQDFARGIVETQKQLRAEKARITAEVAALRAEQEAANEGMKRVTAFDLATQYELGEAGRKALLEAPTPVEMKAKALELALAKARAVGKSTAGVKEIKVGGQPVDIGKMAPSLALGTLMEQEQRK